MRKHVLKRPTNEATSRVFMQLNSDDVTAILALWDVNPHHWTEHEFLTARSTCFRNHSRAREAMLGRSEGRYLKDVG
jgi:hypothetical protein